jgi:hypothetical protein
VMMTQQTLTTRVTMTMTRPKVASRQDFLTFIH